MNDGELEMRGEMKTTVRKIWVLGTIMLMILTMGSFATSIPTYNIRAFEEREVTDLDDGKRMEYYSVDEKLIFSQGAYNGSKYVVYHSNNTYTTSADGITWSAPVKIDYSIDGLTFHNGFFYAVLKYSSEENVRRIAASKDLINWDSLAEYNPKKNYYTMSKTNGKMICLDDSNSPIYILENGKIQEVITPTSKEMYELGEVHWDGTAYVSSIYEGRYASKDLKNWVFYDESDNHTFYPSDEVAFNNRMFYCGRYYVYSGNRGEEYLGIYSSNDHMTHTILLKLGKMDYESPENRTNYKLSYGYFNIKELNDGLFAYIYGHSYYSKDGIHWDKDKIMGLDGIYANGRYLMNDKDSIYTSIDGVNWHETVVDPSHAMNYEITSFEASEKGYVYVADPMVYSEGDELFYSYDGYNWQQASLPVDNNKLLWSVSYVYGKYYVSSLENNDRIMYISSDLANWTRHKTNLKGQINDIVPYNGIMYGCTTDDR